LKLQYVVFGLAISY